ncbi:MAG: hypothetical protein ACLFS4_06765 [Opitutales bacterium]
MTDIIVISCQVAMALSAVVGLIKTNTAQSKGTHTKADLAINKYWLLVFSSLLTGFLAFAAVGSESVDWRFQAVFVLLFVANCGFILSLFLD